MVVLGLVESYIFNVLILFFIYLKFFFGVRFVFFFVLVLIYKVIVFLLFSWRLEILLKRFNICKEVVKEMVDLFKMSVVLFVYWLILIFCLLIVMFLMFLFFLIVLVKIFV